MQWYSALAKPVCGQRSPVPLPRRAQGITDRAALEFGLGQAAQVFLLFTEGEDHGRKNGICESHGEAEKSWVVTGSGVQATCWGVGR